MRHSIRFTTLLVVGVLLAAGVSFATAEEPFNEHFRRTWARTDQPVLSGTVPRTWIWGPQANSGELEEDYVEAADGTRTVQYFDKSRMEINDPDGDPTSPFYVTNGLLVIELMTGQMQLGHDTFEEYEPSTANVAGDQGDPDSPTYAGLAALRDRSPAADGAVLTQRLAADGTVRDDPGLAAHEVTAAFRVTVPGIDHQVASPFWAFLNSSGPIVVDFAPVDERLFEPWFYATGYPITEAYWADVQVGGTERLVLMQCFERRCLTYTPGNPEGFLTEAGNVGQHYYSWRYEQVAPEPTPTSLGPGEPDQTPTPANPSPTPVTPTPELPDPTPTTPAEPTYRYTYADQWGSKPQSITPLDDPLGIAVDAGNNFWVTEFKHRRFVIFDEHGVYRQTIGALGSGPGELLNPMDAAFGADGRAYLADSGNHRIEIFSATGANVGSWGSKGSGNGQFNGPAGIAMRGEIVYVLDTYNHRVQMFNPEGVYLGKFGEKGTGDGQFDAPEGIAIDPEGNVLVTDQYNARVQKFTAQGTFISKFGSPGDGPGQFSIPRGIDVDEDGWIYVADSSNHRVQKFNANGEFILQWGGVRGTKPGEFQFPAGLAVDHDGNVYVVDENNSRVQKFTSDGDLLFQVSDGRRGVVNNPSDITAHGDTLLVVDSLNNKPAISTYSSFGALLHLDDLSDADAGVLNDPAAVVVAGDYINFLDRFTSRVAVFNSNWSYVGYFGAPGNGPGQFTTPRDIAVDDDRNYYIADSANGRIQKFNFNRQFVAQWGGTGDGQVTFQKLQGLAVHGDRVYATDYVGHRVHVFDRDGNYFGYWGEEGSEPGQLKNPNGIAVNADGYVLVVETGNNRVQVFSPEGESVSIIGGTGAGHGQFSMPVSVAVDEKGNVFVSDNGNNRIQKFVPASP